jgi:hypothetical protein
MFSLQGSSPLEEWIDATKPFVQSFSSERPALKLINNNYYVKPS